MIALGIAYPIAYPIRYLTQTLDPTRIVIVSGIASPVPVPEPDKGYDSLLDYRLALANARATASGR